MIKQSFYGERPVSGNVWNQRNPKSQTQLGSANVVEQTRQPGVVPIELDLCAREHPIIYFNHQSRKILFVIRMVIDIVSAIASD
jgi:hypothetical protein